MAEAPTFEGGPQFTSDTGHILLSWDSDGPVELLMAGRSDLSDARSLYTGPQRAYFLSGLPNGEYHLLLTGEDGASSEPAVLTVAHQSLAQALWLTLVGLIITIGIITVIVRGAHDD